LIQILLLQKLKWNQMEKSIAKSWKMEKLDPYEMIAI
jgi:hypothetical protein